MNKLTLTKESFFESLTELIKSGVTFTAEESGDKIIITFSGGY